MDLLKDKTAVITGAHRGIGKAILEKFCEYGCNCFVINRKEDPVFTEYCENLHKEYSVKMDLFYKRIDKRKNYKPIAYFLKLWKGKSLALKGK